MTGETGRQAVQGRNVLLTGPSRSGTTLTCELLNRVNDTVALDEPMNALSMLGQEVPEPSLEQPRSGVVRSVASRLRGRREPPDAVVACNNIERFLAASRASLIDRGVAVSRNVGGKVLGQKVADEQDGSGLRRKLADFGEIAVGKELSDHFLLAVKQTSGFIALLGPLVERFEVFAVIRNPLAILTSWQTLPFHPGDGHVRLGEGIDWALRDRLARLPDRTDRQFELLLWYFGRIHDVVSPGHILRYEEITASGGRCLQAITPAAEALDVALEDRNANRSIHDRQLVRTLGQRLLDTEGPWWHYYTPESVQELVAA